jgi:peptide-methionine (S)-S-oxide reductase
MKKTIQMSMLFILTIIGTLPACNSNPSNSQSMDLTPLPTQKTDTAILAAGCFWCIEAIFQELDGVISVTSGYTGGAIKNPSYKEVCTGTTGHAEAARIIYDPSIITYDELLEVFWKTHDPTTLNRQGADAGTQYRSAVYYLNENQKEIAEKYKAELNAAGAFDKPIVTEITEFDNKFYVAEDYHQNYYNQNGSQGYCTMVIRPKVEKFQKVFKDKLKKK